MKVIGKGLLVIFVCFGKRKWDVYCLRLHWATLTIPYWRCPYAGSAPADEQAGALSLAQPAPTVAKQQMRMDWETPNRREPVWVVGREGLGL